MARRIKIGNLSCMLSNDAVPGKIAYILYPMDDLLDNWIDPAAKQYGTSIAVITGMDWQNVFSPWPAKGVPAGSPDFKGESPGFLKMLQNEVIPKIEEAMGLAGKPERTLVGVSMSGLFVLWQWMLCDTFKNIASLSGSFWYEGFMQWFDSRQTPPKNGLAYFLLGIQEPKTRVKAFQCVGENTTAIVERLKTDGVRTEFQSVHGNHYSNPLPRLEDAFSAIYAPARRK
ncbi:MAG: alpha/beta hydrolase-fold protein [Clostridium sp.]|nr:alpha/beta hydrolase-fold protein [Clostridium sp.]